MKRSHYIRLSDILPLCYYGISRSRNTAIIIYRVESRTSMHRTFAEKIAGEITLSDVPGQTIKKWRDIFEISQQDLAKHIKLSPSIISDYESGRRKSPGIGSIKKIVNALIEIDDLHGAKVARKFKEAPDDDVIKDIREFPYGHSSADFIETIEGEVIAGSEYLDRELHGYTIIDSLKAIVSFNSQDYIRFYGWSSQRALLFTDVKTGRSPMIAIRAHPMKPAMVIYIQPKHVDKLAKEIAEREEIPLVVTNLSMNALKKILLDF
jgi:putative transcriptional regulator